MSNPYANGRKTSKGAYRQLYDPTVDSDSSYAYDSYHRPFPEPEPEYDTGDTNPFEGRGRSYSYASEAPPAPSHSNSIGARRVPSYREYQQQHHNLAVPTALEPAGSHPSTESFAPTQPWDASAVGDANPEISLIDGPTAPVASQASTRRRPSIARSIRRYFDPESQSEIGRNSSRYGLPAMSTINEYADDEELDYQIPISGDEYQLNTWAPDARSAYSNREAPSVAPSHGGDYDEEHDISHGFSEDNGSGYDNVPLEPWMDEGEQDMLEKSPSDDSNASEQSYNGDSDEKGLRTIELFRGNLVLDCPVSNQLLQQYPAHRPVREFTHMRYTAATCDPSAFVDEQYTLRQMCYTQPRQTELFICVTVYNEDDILLARTLQGVFNNVRHLCHRDRSQTWGTDAWKKVVVCVVADGRNKLNPRAKALMAALGAYQEGFAKNMVNDKAVEAHIYEYTTMVRISKVSESEGVKLTTEKATPVQLMFCMKEKNQKKINSHRWFFQAFSEVLKPNVCVLLDSGTRPGNHSIYHLWKSFDRHPRVAGACGEIAAMLGTGGKKLFNPLIASQNFEYKMSNILDKPSESIFGFITVLPGAFSAYRYAALQNHPNGSGPLEKYFKGEKLEGKGGVFQANMYLAEDRILCWELVSKKGSDWLLTYVKTAKAHTDVPERFSELILQRRRWLNGSFFAQVYSLAHFYGIWRSGHSIGRKLALHIQFLYQSITLIFSWFSLANFFLVFHILSSALGSSSAGFAPGKILSIVLTWVYAACILMIFILSFGNRPQGTRALYNMTVVFFALMMGYMIFCTIYISVKGIEYAICANGGFQAKLLWTNSTFRDLIVSLLATYALYALISALFLDPWHVATSMLQYVILSPVYVNVLNVYAFCNTHDISWGTKGDTVQKLDLGIVRADEEGKLELELPTSTDLVDKYYVDEINVLSSAPPQEKAAEPSESDQKQDYYALFRSMVVLFWVLMNLALVAVVLNIAGFQGLIGDDKNSSSGAASTSPSTDSGTGGTGSSSGLSRLARRASEGSCNEITAGGSIVSKVYMAVVFWSVAGMAAYRFVLSIIYLLKLISHRV